MDGKKLFGMLPGYLTEGIGETYHMDVLSALKETYPDKTLCSIIYYLNSSEFIEMKKNTDKFIEKHGLKKAVEESLKENSNLIPVSLFDTRRETNMSGIFKNDKFLINL